MEQRTSILQDLRQNCSDYLNPKLVDAWIVETPEANYLEYMLQDTHECTITYRHNLNLWGEPPNSYSNEEMLEMGYLQEDLDEISKENWPPTTVAEDFIEAYVIYENTTLAMVTELFTEKWAESTN